MSSVSLSKINPDLRDFILQFQRELQNKGTWQDFITTAAGQSIIEYISAVGELDQYSIARVFEEMFPETAQIDSSVYASVKRAGVRLRRKSPSSISFRMPGSGTGDQTEADDQLLNNPYYDPSGATLSDRITNPVLFWGYGKIRRFSTDDFPITQPATIPPYTRFSTSEGTLYNRTPIKFSAAGNPSPQPFDSSLFGYQEDSEGNQVPVTLYRGDIYDRFFTPTGREFFSILSSENEFLISEDDVQCFIDGEPIILSKQGLWNFRDESGFVCQDLTTSDGRLHVLFGNEYYGQIPQPSSNIELRYAVVDGSESNNTSFKSRKIASADYDFIDNQNDSLLGSLSGGSDERSAQVYRTLGPALSAAEQGYKGVNNQDYNAIFRNYSGNIDAKCLGQRETNPSNPAYMNLVKVATYPKKTRAQNQLMFDDVRKRTMFSTHFYTDYSSPSSDTPIYPIYRAFNIRANVFCRNTVDFVDARDNYIEPAILELIDRKNEARIGKIGKNISKADIIKAIQNSISGIDYVELLEPSEDVLVETKSPRIIEHRTTTGSVIPVGQYEYFIQATFSHDGSINQSTNLVPERTYTVDLDASVNTLQLYFKGFPNFSFSEPEKIPVVSDYNLSNFSYFTQLNYILWRRDLSQPNPVWQYSDQSPVEYTAVQGGYFYFNDHDSVYTTDTPPMLDTSNPGVAVLGVPSGTGNPWRAENTISMFYTDRGGD